MAAPLRLGPCTPAPCCCSNMESDVTKVGSARTSSNGLCKSWPSSRSEPGGVGRLFLCVGEGTELLLPLYAAVVCPAPLPPLAEPPLPLPMLTKPPLTILTNSLMIGCLSLALIRLVPAFTVCPCLAGGWQSSRLFRVMILSSGNGQKPSSQPRRSDVKTCCWESDGRLSCFSNTEVWSPSCHSCPRVIGSRTLVERNSLPSDLFNG